MSDAPDPLGKRALFWAPAERDEAGPRHSEEGDVLGKRALFSEAAAGTVTSDVRRTGVTRSTRALTGRPGHPATGRPTATSTEGPEPDLGGQDHAHLERPAGSGMFGTLIVECSSCRVRSQVDLVEFVVLHLPVWLWRPGRGYTRFMMCPACRRRTWVSASWTSSSR